MIFIVSSIVSIILSELSLQSYSAGSKEFIHLLTDQAQIVEVLVGVLAVGHQVCVERATEVDVIAAVAENMAGRRGAGELNAGCGGDADRTGASGGPLAEDHRAVLMHEPRIGVAAGERLAAGQHGVVASRLCACHALGEIGVDRIELIVKVLTFI